MYLALKLYNSFTENHTFVSMYTLLHPSSTGTDPLHVRYGSSSPILGNAQGWVRGSVVLTLASLVEGQEGPVEGPGVGCAQSCHHFVSYNPLQCISYTNLWTSRTWQCCRYEYIQPLSPLALHLSFTFSSLPFYHMQ